MTDSRINSTAWMLLWGVGKLGLGKLGFGKLGRGATSKSA